MLSLLAYPRKYPEQKPAGHTPAAPRYAYVLSDPVHTIVCEYFAAQTPRELASTADTFFPHCIEALQSANAPDRFETMSFVDEAQFQNDVVIAYWTDPLVHAQWVQYSALIRWFRSSDRLVGPFGYWRETLVVPATHLETIYSAPDYPIGLARSPAGAIKQMTTNGYFGAMRDRLPLSAIDSLASPYNAMPTGLAPVDSFKRRLQVHPPVNTVVIRSGQFWEGADDDQLQDYVHNLQPKLQRGMDHLVSHTDVTGCLSLRTMTNLSEAGLPRAETSVNAFFLSLAHLEQWARSHDTHLDIYKHAIAMNQLYGTARQVVTWHEVFVLPPNTTLEYVNCHPKTGLLPFYGIWGAAVQHAHV